MRRAAKIDGNQTEIVEALRKVGASVQSLAAVGRGVPDLLVGYKGKTFLIEVKDGRKPGWRITQQQAEWHGAWRGGPLFIVENVEKALQILGINDD